MLLRPLPKLKRYLAYLPEGPVIDWAAPDIERWLQPMVAHLKEQGALSVKMGPPVVTRRWSAEAVKVMAISESPHPSICIVAELLSLLPQADPRWPADGRHKGGAADSQPAPGPSRRLEEMHPVEAPRPSDDPAVE